MRIGVPKEIKKNEHRVGLIPASVRDLKAWGHEVYVESNAGNSIGFSDAEYASVGAKILDTAKDVFDHTDMIIKVKEPQPQECQMLHEGQILFTFLHLAADTVQTDGLLASKAIAIAYETVTDPKGTLPLLAPMSEVAGRMATQVGARTLEKSFGGPGILLGGVPGVEPARVTIIGGGVVGYNAALMAIGLGAKVTIIDTSLPRLRELTQVFGSRIEMMYPTKDTLEKALSTSDLIIGAVLIPGAAAPKILTRQMLRLMKPATVFVDVAIDQGGCSETSRPTTHEDPTYLDENVIHYCVANIPGAVPRTSAFALNNATLPFIVQLANLGHKKAFQNNPHLFNGLNVYKGQLTNQAVAESLNRPYQPFDLSG